MGANHCLAIGFAGLGLLRRRRVLHRSAAGDWREQEAASEACWIRTWSPS
jgi:hypothetical protein